MRGSASRLVIRNARVLTLAGPRQRRREGMRELGVVARGDVVVESGVIREVVAAGGPPAPPRANTEQIDAAGRVLMPGFVDCHTHACWAGDRLDEWEMRRRGASYLEILKAGGGIMSTVRAVRAADGATLESLLRERLGTMLRCGTTTAEVKSGYGLTLDGELKMLRAIEEKRRRSDGETKGGLPEIVSTALIGHAIDADVPGFVERTISETLPAVSREFPGVAVDAFCEQGAWSLADTVRLLARAKELGHPVRVHADQFNSLGMVGEAVRLGAVSVDHLEATTAEDAAALGRSETFGVILPACGFHVDGRYPDGRGLIDAGVKLAVATNYNPGSAPTPSMPMTIALAVRHCGLEPAEAIVACTLHGAGVLGLADRGQIAPGQRADLILLRHTDERMLAYEFGANPVDVVIRGGDIVSPRASR
jgi:imidazolonepropionase